MHQPTLLSPCIMGEPCRVCVIHVHCYSGHPCKGCRKGKAYECERAYPTKPAFVIKASAAVQLVRDGVANFIHRNSALQLNFARLTHLRDLSCNVDGQIVWQYVVGIRCVRIAVNLGWGKRIATVKISTVETEDRVPIEHCSV